MARILFDARPLAEPLGGISRVSARLLSHLRATRPDAAITVITTGTHRPHLGHAADGLAHLHVRIPNKLWSSACLLHLTSLDRMATRLAGHSFDELILPNIGFVGTTQIPTTILVHDLSFLIEPHWFPWKMRLWHRVIGAAQQIQHATHVWCVSRTTATDVEQLLHVSAERISVLTPEIILDSNTSPDPQPVTRNPYPYILAFDGNARKNTGTVIAAVARLREDPRFSNLELRVIGPRPTPLLPHSLTPPSWLSYSSPSDATLTELYRHAHALLYPSWYEGFGLPLHEAAQYGIPPLASAHGALPETAPEGTILIPPTKPHLWVTALKQLLSDAPSVD